MSLECLLLTQDACLLKAVKAICTEAGVELLMRKDVASASELSARRHLDGFFIDCDDVPGGIEILNSIRRKRANRRPVVILVVNGRTSIGEAFELGANFVISKPLEDGRLLTLLDLALPKMEREHRRYFRYPRDSIGRTRLALWRVAPGEDVEHQRGRFSHSSQHASTRGGTVRGI